MPRERLPDRRASTIYDLKHNSHGYRATVSRFADGRAGEVFLNADKHDTEVDMWARDMGIITSIALQFGVPLETLRHAVSRDHRDQPMSPIGAVLDLIAKEIS